MNNIITKQPDSAQMRQAICRLEDDIKNLPGNGAEESGITWVHRFTPGLYTREMTVPANVAVVGMIHKTEHISIMLSGRMAVPDPANGGWMEIEAPIVEVAQPGIKRVGIAITEVVWITVHPTELTDVDEILELIVTDDFSEVQHLVDQADYKQWALEYGFDDDVIEGWKQIPFDKVKLDGVEVAPSPRHGFGVFVKRLFTAGETIATAIKNDRLTMYSRYANHSNSPNAEMVHRDGDIYLVAIRDVDREEITVDYRNNLALSGGEVK